MVKPMTQITFEFNAANEEQNSSVALRPPAVIEEVTEDVTEEGTEQESPSIPLVSLNKKPVSNRGRRSLKEMATKSDLIQVPEDEIYFRSSIILLVK